MDSLKPSRRDFLKWSSATLLANWVPGQSAFAGPFDGVPRIIGPDKKLRPEWVKSLFERGEPERFTGDDLKFIGMPVGGIACGLVYLAGDGRLWLWDVFNRQHEGAVEKSVNYQGAKLRARDGANYVQPLEAISPLDQGFTLRVDGKVRALDHTGFRKVIFTGAYPIGTVEYEAPDCPVRVTLEAFSPFIPLNADDSSLPATVMSFKITNNGDKAADVLLEGRLENAVCIDHRDLQGTRRIHSIRNEAMTFLQSSIHPPQSAEKPRPEIVFEDWSKPAYQEWTVEGTAFGQGPVKRADVPAYQGDLGGPGDAVANSHAAAPGNDVRIRDDAFGRLVSREFTIERNFIRFWIGGGSFPETALRLVVDGKVLHSASGKKNNRMSEQAFAVADLLGKKARLEIVDGKQGDWGHIGVGRIVFSDEAPRATLDQLPDFGTMGIGLLGGTPQSESGTGEVPAAGKQVGMLGRGFTLPPGESRVVDFVLAWHFPNQPVHNGGHYYASRFTDAHAVADYVAKNFERLTATTRLWRDTWNDSSLPHWFLNRTFANTSILATTTCLRFRDKRFWAWEGTGCCPGTCTHVWHYAQAVGRVFPEIERQQRLDVDFGKFLRDDGTIAFRGEDGDTYAIDGQAGRILGALREHQMSPDDAFLKQAWPCVRKALEKIIRTDGDADGLIFGPLHNTLDADWHGLVPWLAGLYHAALKAGEMMAMEMGDTTFAEVCRAIRKAGEKNLDQRCWREDFGYYVQEPDSKASKSIGVYDGCHIDQVLGQSWARQVSLGEVMNPEHTRRALKSLWDYNFTPDVGPYRDSNKPGRWYAMPGDGGLLMVTHPFTPVERIIGRDHWTFMYFNECMSGFEHQAASHMIWDGMVMEGLAITRVIHDRYHPRLRNPYNEVECSDHYARAMASYGSFIAACGYESHGPKGHLGFAPRIHPENFRAAFTAAEGWGTYSQKTNAGGMDAEVSLKYGKLRLKTLALECDAGSSATSNVGGVEVKTTFTRTGKRVLLTFDRDVEIPAGETLRVLVR